MPSRTSRRRASRSRILPILFFFSLLFSLSVSVSVSVSFLVSHSQSLCLPPFPPFISSSISRLCTNMRQHAPPHTPTTCNTASTASPHLLGCNGNPAQNSGNKVSHSHPWDDEKTRSPQWNLRPERTKIKLRKRLYPLGMTRLTVGADYDPLGGEWRCPTRLGQINPCADSINDPSIYPSIQSIHQSIYLSIYLSIHLSIYPSIYLSIYPSIHVNIHPPTTYVRLRTCVAVKHLTVNIFSPASKRRGRTQ